MYVGFDVGGTFTDGVIISEGKITANVKVPTYQQVSDSIIEALEKILQDRDPRQIKRVVLSTTIITNIIAQGKQDPVGLILMPGPGVNPAVLKFAGPFRIIDGAIDYRGRILNNFKENQLKEAAQNFLTQGIKKIVVAGKFSQRNRKLEDDAVQFLKENFPQLECLPSSAVSGQLNWVRRANGAVYSLATREAYYAFVAEVKETVKRLGLTCPVQILKADGGTMPLDVSLEYPLEALYSGPAASALGALAVTDRDVTAVVLDIGGTTTDLALILNGQPLLAEKGAFLQGYPIPVRALAVSSIPLGGDNALKAEDGRLVLAPREGKAMCLGGPCLTVTDVMALRGYSKLSLNQETRKACESLAGQLALPADKLIDLVLERFIEQIELKLEEMFKSWEEEPAYRIWQVLSKRNIRPELVICLGGPAEGVGRVLGERKGWQVKVPPYAQVANAVGAALARNTLRLEYIADTEQNIFSTNIGGYQGKLPKRMASLAEAKSAALGIFKELIEQWGLEQNLEPEILYEESFNMVRGWSTTGKILQIGLQTPPGLTSLLNGEVVSHE